jgi:hypothetical protein
MEKGNLKPPKEIALTRLIAVNIAKLPELRK